VVSSKFDKAFLDTIQSNDRVPDIMADLIPSLKRNGTGFVGLVPWRPDEHPSLGLFRNDRGVWLFKDRARDEGGNTVQLVMKITGQGFSESVEWLADRLGISLPEKGTWPETKLVPASERIEILKKLYDTARELVGTVAAGYLEKRGLLESAKALGVRCFEPGNPEHILPDAYENGLTVIARWVREKYAFLVYPGQVNGQTVAHRCRLLMSATEARQKDIQTNHWMPIASKEELQLPTTWPTLPDTLPIELVLTEGETDCMAVRTLVKSVQAYAIFGTGGLSDRTKEFEQITKQKPQVTLAFQRDTASAKKAAKLIEKFSRYNVSCRALVPAGGANDWAQLIEWDQCSVDTLDVISALLGDHSISRAFDAMTKHINDVEAGKIESIPLPWPTLDWCFNKTGIPPGTIGLLSAKTGVGKTWFVYQWAMYIAGYRLNTGLPVFIANTEMPEQFYSARLLALASGKKEVVTLSNPELVRELQFEYQSEIDKLPLEITPPESQTVDDIVSLLESKARDNKFLIVDHIGDLSFSGKSWEELPRITLLLREIARKTGSVILMVTHLKATELGVDMLAYSKQIENAVDWSFSLSGFQSEEPKQVTVAGPCGKEEITANRMVIVRKNRYGISSTRIAIDFNEETLRMKDLGRIVGIKK